MPPYFELGGFLCHRPELGLSICPHHPPLTRPCIRTPGPNFFKYGGCHFLIVTNLKSGWPTTYKLGFTIIASVVISALRQTFADTAVPTILYSDGGPQFTARAMGHFLQDWGVQHEMSSPHYPQSNGFAEADVKAMKALVRQCWEITSCTVNADKWAKGLLQWRNTPQADGLSPAQVVYGHPVCSTCSSTTVLSPLSGSAPSRRPMNAPPPYTTGSSICIIEPLMNYHSLLWTPKWLYKATAPVSRINTGPLWRLVTTTTIWSLLPVGGFGDVTEDSPSSLPCGHPRPRQPCAQPCDAVTRPCVHAPCRCPCPMRIRPL